LDHSVVIISKKYLIHIFTVFTVHSLYVKTKKPLDNFFWKLRVWVPRVAGYARVFVHGVDTPVHDVHIQT